MGKLPLQNRIWIQFLLKPVIQSKFLQVSLMLHTIFILMSAQGAYNKTFDMGASFQRFKPWEHGYTKRVTLVYLYHVNCCGHHKNCWLQSWTLYKSADCRWISITIICVSFTNSATDERLEQVQLCNRLIDQSADNITGLKCAKEFLILKYKCIQNPWLYNRLDDRTLYLKKVKWSGEHKNIHCCQYNIKGHVNYKVL